MSIPTRLFAPDGEEIADLSAWREHAPPEQPMISWRDGYSAKEHARAWVASGYPAMPDELAAALGALVDFDNVYGRPEHPTDLDDFRGRGRQHDMFACLRQADTTSFVAGIEAKAGEDFDGLVSDRAVVGPPSNRRARCNLLARALFGREVVGEATGEILDVDLATHGYQLWSAAVATLREAQRGTSASARSSCTSSCPPTPARRVLPATGATGRR